MLVEKGRETGAVFGHELLRFRGGRIMLRISTKRGQVDESAADEQTEDNLWP